MSQNQQTLGHKPDGYFHCRQVLEGSCNIGSFVSVVGIVIDRKDPIKTRGTDWKCEIKLMDKTLESTDDDALVLNIFQRTVPQIPEAGPGDIILIQNAKVQKRGYENANLLTNAQTKMTVFAAKRIPKPPASALSAVAWPKESSSKIANQKVLDYVTFVHYATSRQRVPTVQDFEAAKIQSRNVKEKFSTLDKVNDGNFYDLVVEVCKSYDLGDRITLWVTDYTENENFWLMTEQNETSASGDLTSDPYGYMDKLSIKTASEAPAQQSFRGPLGKRSMQVTIYDPHLSMIREPLVRPGSWLSLRNLHIKFGRNGANYEGFLRGDSGSFHSNQVRISHLDVEKHKEDLGPLATRLAEALDRKRAYRKETKEVDDDIQSAAVAGQKRKALKELEPTKPNSKAQRKAKREKERQRAAAAAAEETRTPEAVPDPAETPCTRVKCEGMQRPVTRIGEMLQQHCYKLDVEGEEVEVPLTFVNANYRALVRVTNFDPPLLEDFAYHSTAIDDDDVVPNGDDDDDDDESDPDSEAEGASQVSQGWRWSFSLELEDATDKSDPRRLWVVVNNPSAQNLLNLDAADLRQNDKVLEQLRDRLFSLWGDLEEIKSRQREELRDQVDGGQPPPDSSPPPGGGGYAKAQAKAKEEEAPKNRCFYCCVRQYGIKVAEEDEEKRRNGPGWRWERLYGLYGTKISARG